MERIVMSMRIYLVIAIVHLLAPTASVAETQLLLHTSNVVEYINLNESEQPTVLEGTLGELKDIAGISASAGTVLIVADCGGKADGELGMCAVDLSSGQLAKVPSLGGIRAAAITQGG